MLKFFEICPNAHPTFHWAEYPDPMPTSSEVRELFWGTRDPLAPPIYRVRGVRKCGDLISSYVWSRRMCEALARCAATGYSAYPVTVLKGHQELLGYAGIRIFGVGGPFDAGRSWAKYGPAGGLIGHEAVYMDEEQWDGSDLFTIPGLGGAIFAVERVVKELQKLKPTNVTFTLSTESKL